MSRLALILIAASTLHAGTVAIAPGTREFDPQITAADLAQAQDWGLEAAANANNDLVGYSFAGAVEWAPVRTPWDYEGQYLYVPPAGGRSPMPPIPVAETSEPGALWACAGLTIFMLLGRKKFLTGVIRREKVEESKL